MGQSKTKMGLVAVVVLAVLALIAWLVSRD